MYKVEQKIKLENLPLVVTPTVFAADVEFIIEFSKIG